MDLPNFIKSLKYIWTRSATKILLLSSKRQTFNVAHIKLLKDIIIMPALATLLLIGTLFKFLLAIISELDLQMLHIWFLCKIYFFIKWRTFIFT